MEQTALCILDILCIIMHNKNTSFHINECLKLERYAIYDANLNITINVSHLIKVRKLECRYSTIFLPLPVVERGTDQMEGG